MEIIVLINKNLKNFTTRVRRGEILRRLNNKKKELLEICYDLKRREEEAVI